MNRERAARDNRLVAGSSPPSPTTQSCANPEFPVSAEYPRFSAVWGGCNRPFAVSAGNEDRPEADWALRLWRPKSVSRCAVKARPETRFAATETGLHARDSRTLGFTDGSRSRAQATASGSIMISCQNTSAPKPSSTRLSRQVPALSLYLPPARKAWGIEHPRMGIFEAGCLGMDIFSIGIREAA
jgi:hypothetical protein